MSIERDPATAPDEKLAFHVVDWLPPDFGAVGQHAVIYARELASAGQKICLVGLSSEKASRSEECFRRGGRIEFNRIHARHYAKTSLLSRLIWSLQTDARLIWEVIRDPRSKRADILFTGSPPLMLFFAVWAKWLRGARLTYRITDFYPEVLIASLGRKPMALALLERAAWFFRRRVDAFQVLGEDQRKLLLAGGIAPEKITLRRDIAPIAITGKEKAAPVPRELGGRLALLYSGNYGVAHEVDTVVHGLIEHHSVGGGHFGFWLNACGSGVQPIVSRLTTAGIPVAHSAPVALDRLPSLLLAADVLLISLRDGFSGLVLPSKVYGCLSSGRPILFVGPKSSDVHLLCTGADGLHYEQVDPGDVAGFSEALDRLAMKIVRRSEIEMIESGSWYC